ncbi:MAG: hypothetical protein KatS3mg105_3872 [Gemmatales bacterium]|nr:MAG: hypothetical protein KatS3mg105_3872 [Gemmatales bacterium]
MIRDIVIQLAPSLLPRRIGIVEDAKMEWLTENPTPAYLVLGMAFLGVMACLWHKRDVRFLYAAFAIVFAGVLIWLIDFLVVTDFEQMELEIRHHARFAESGDLDKIFRRLSSDFRYRRMDAVAFRALCDRYASSWPIQKMAVWDFEKCHIDPEAGRGEIAFSVKVRADWSRGEFYRCRAQFHREDGQWKLAGFALFNPFVNTNEEIVPP